LAAALGSAASLTPTRAAALAAIPRKAFPRVSGVVESRLITVSN